VVRLRALLRKSAVRVLVFTLIIIAATAFSPITQPVASRQYCELVGRAPYDGNAVYGIFQVSCTRSALIYLTVRLKFNGTVVHAPSYNSYTGALRVWTDSFRCPGGYTYQASATATIYTSGYAPLNLHDATIVDDC